MAMIDMLISYTAGAKKDLDAVKKYTESSLDLLNKATDMKDDFAEAYILKFAVNSNRWMYEMDKMNDIMAKQSEAKELAKKYDPDNPRLYLIDGINTYYTPKVLEAEQILLSPCLKNHMRCFRLISLLMRLTPIGEKTRFAVTLLYAVYRKISWMMQKNG